jgi:hypothetical protein
MTSPYLTRKPLSVPRQRGGGGDQRRRAPGPGDARWGLPGLAMRVRGSRKPEASRALLSVKPRARIAVLGPVLAALALLVLAATPASAEQARIFSGSFGGEHSTTVDPYPLGKPFSVAVEQSTGDVYASDPVNFRVEKFGPSGEFLLMFGKKVNTKGATEAEQDVCTAK